MKKIELNIKDILENYGFKLETNKWGKEVYVMDALTFLEKQNPFKDLIDIEITCFDSFYDNDMEIEITIKE